jgi:transcriptional regulator with XRE-family HTH domain
MSDMPSTVGGRLREWRRRRRFSQLDLACEAEVSTRHLSFLETGRSAPSREMVLRLAEALEIPLRERNALLLAAGFAPVFEERSLAGPDLASARSMVDLILTRHDPFPALAVDGRWNLLSANGAAQMLMAAVDAALLVPPINVLRVSLHPGGLGPRIVNFAEWRGHLLGRLRRQASASGDPFLADLLAELSAYPGSGGAQLPAPNDRAIAAPLKLRTEAGLLSFLSFTTVFGAPLDITLSEMALESFFPADAITGEMLRAMAAKRVARDAA